MSALSRRDFARILGTSSLSLLAAPAIAEKLAAAAAAPLLPAGYAPDEKYWKSIRGRFLFEGDRIAMNAANLCPAPAEVLDALYRATREIDRDPSQQNRARFADAKEAARRRVAGFLRVKPEEILLTRNTSEANNLISAGLELKPGDEVVVLSDNHPSNLSAWRERAKRAGYTVRVVEQPNPHPGTEYYLAAVAKAITPQTKVLAFTHLTSTVGDLMPAAELCRLARERGVLTMLDGAQSFGGLDVDLSALQPDFYSGSAHKWPCGAREAGVLYIRSDVQARVWPSIYSLYPGSTGLSRTHEGFGQRDEPALIALDVALAFHERIGQAAIEQRGRELAQLLMAGLRKIDGVRVWTSQNPQHAGAVVSFQPAGLDPRALSQALYVQHRIACSTRGGTDRPGLRFSPHLYNLHADVERVTSAVARYVKSGL